MKPSSPNPQPIPIRFAADSTLFESVGQSVARAREAQIAWQEVGLDRRLKVIRSFRQLLVEKSLAIAEISASSRGRPIRETLAAEVIPLAEACHFLEKNAEKILAPKTFGGALIPRPGRARIEIVREPFGTILVIAPGNYPLLLPGVQVLQALAAGNAVIIKPGGGGTPCANAIRDLFVQGGGDGRLCPVLPETPEAAQVAIRMRPDKILFTGSAPIGQLILAESALDLVPTTLELSGNDAVLIRADADLELTVRALAFGLTLNGGATCMAPKRVFVHRTLATELEGRLAQRFQDPEFKVTQAQRESILNPAPRSATSWKVADLATLAREAVREGAHSVVGDSSLRGDGSTPIVLAGVTSSSRLLRQDLFGPLMAIVTVADDREAVGLINDCPYALGASVFSQDVDAARALAGQINAGVVTLNDLIVPTADPRVPFGGRKRSGFGITRGAEGLLELTQLKVVTRSPGRFRPAFDAATPGDELLLSNYLSLVHGEGIRWRAAAAVALVRNLVGRISGK